MVGVMRLTRRSIFLPVAAAAALCLPSTASAEVAHVVRPGETLWTIAQANNLLTSALARYNGLSEDAQVVLGSTVQVPTEAAALGVVNGAPAPTAAPAPTSGAPTVQGAYTVRVGDTLSGLAAQSGVPLAQMAAMNGLDPDGFLVAGTVVKLPTGAPTPARASQPAPAPVVAAASPAPTPVRMSAGEVSSIAAQHGVPASLATAIAWQESGFNNSMVSSANARGVMQVMPGTWDYVQQNLTSQTLDPASAADNVRAGSLYLAQLLRDTGGDARLAAAGYYQGLASVRRIGLLPETERYVDNVLALQGRFGG
jgi:soluble lytic murein transglycosylase-like protein